MVFNKYIKDRKKVFERRHLIDGNTKNQLLDYLLIHQVSQTDIYNYCFLNVGAERSTMTVYVLYDRSWPGLQPGQGSS